MGKHNAQSLGKYGGTRVWVLNFEGKTAQGTIRSIDFGTNSIVFIDRENEKAISGQYDASHIYPILKTVEDLTEEDKKQINDLCSINFRITRRLNPNLDLIANLILKGRNLSDYILEKLLELNIGAIPSKESPTGYISIHDGLPCKSWGEVFK